MLTIGEKIKQIRKAKGFSQENLAHDIGLSTSTICRIEQGLTPINHEIIKAIKKALVIESAPLLSGEGEGYRERLYIWHKLILEGHLIEARTLQEKLVAITSLPYEIDLTTLYRLFEICLLLAEKNYLDADKGLKNIATCLDEMVIENKYHYYCSMGWLYMSIGQDRAKEPLEYLCKAYDLQQKPDGDLYYRIARCYTRLGQPYRSINMLEKAYKAYGNNKTTKISLDLDNKMALNCIDIGDTVRARKILEKCLENAKNISNDRYIFVILHNIGSSYARDKHWETALAFFMEASEYIDVEDYNYFVNRYYKARCLIALKRFAQCKELLAHEPMDSKQVGDSDYLTIMYKSLNHLMSLREKSSYDYIENITMPYLIKVCNITEALDYSEIMEAFYESKNSTRKALKFAKIQRDIYKRMVETGHVESCDTDSKLKPV